MDRRIWGVLGGAILLFQLVGCAATTTFMAYPHRITPSLGQLDAATPPDFAKLLSSERKGSDRILYNLEHGRLAQLFGQIEISKADFAASIAAIRENEQRATVSASRFGAHLAAVATNDNALPYTGEGYERVLLHHYQAMNYLLRADLEGAGVEARWANAEQEESLRRHARELEQAGALASEQNLANPAGAPAFQQQYAQLDEIAGKVKNSFQNASSFYLSGLIYELQGEKNDAYIDYKKALEIYPDNSYLQRDVLRLAKSLQMSDDLAALSARFPDALTGAEEATLDGELVLFFEEGLVPPREEIKLALPIPSGIATVALPFYRTSWSDYEPLEVTLHEDRSGGAMTEPLCDVRALAVKSLQERMPMIMTRQLVRAVSKAAAQQTAKERFGLAGQFGMMVYSVVSENADLRSWLTLPQSVQLLRIPLPAGRNRLRLQQPGSPDSTTLDVDVKKGGVTIAYVVKSVNRYHTAAVAF